MYWFEHRAATHNFRWKDQLGFEREASFEHKDLIRMTYLERTKMAKKAGLDPLDVAAFKYKFQKLVEGTKKPYSRAGLV